MNRTIKFRAWAKGKMYESYSVDDNGDFCSDIDYINEIETGEITEIIQMQYTGLKDKNGKEIYEGDVISYEIIHSDMKTISNTTKQVKWIKTEVDNGFNLMPCVAERAEIIGNIYETPDLIN